MKQIAVLGAGSWGTSLALLLTNKGYSVRLWSNEPGVIKDIDTNRVNSKYVPGIPFTGEILAMESMADAVKGVEAVLMVVPSNAVREVATQLSGVIDGDPLFINAGKGLESSTGYRMSQVIAESIPAKADDLVVLSGPNLAIEIARQIPTATVVASKNEERAFQAQELVNCHHLRAYRSSDVAGVEVCGSLKNVLAVGAGICDGLGYGDNTKAAFVTRGLTEMMRLGEALGAKPKTFMGLAGVGDVMATCGSKLSRNLRVGMAIGRGLTLEQALAEVKQVAEGVHTCKAAYKIAASLNIYAPITEQLHEILFNGKAPQSAVTDLMLREPKAE
ncbi:MAG: NAD(P)H-dependent glycerol-3-phosphate dehydrogenase [Armatimonadota bacterium]